MTETTYERLLVASDWIGCAVIVAMAYLLWPASWPDWILASLTFLLGWSFATYGQEEKTEAAEADQEDAPIPLPTDRQGLVEHHTSSHG